MKYCREVVVAALLVMGACNTKEKATDWHLRNKEIEKTPTETDSTDFQTNAHSLSPQEIQHQHQSIAAQNEVVLGDAKFTIAREQNNFTLWFQNHDNKTALATYKDLKPSPFIAGIFFPKSQLIKEHVLVSVFGNDENRLLLYNQAGKEIWSLNGGEFFMVNIKNVRYLITIQDTKNPLMSIYGIDLQKIAKQNIPLGTVNDISYWIQKSDKLFAVKNNGKPDIIGNFTIREFNWDTFEFSTNNITITSEELEKFKKIKFDYEVKY